MTPAYERRYEDSTGNAAPSSLSRYGALIPIRFGLTKGDATIRLIGTGDTGPVISGLAQIDTGAATTSVDASIVDAFGWNQLRTWWSVRQQASIV